MGRPKAEAKLRKDSVVYTALRKDERKKLDRVANSTGRSRSDILREAFLVWLKSYEAKA